VAERGPQPSKGRELLGVDLPIAAPHAALAIISPAPIVGLVEPSVDPRCLPGTAKPRPRLLDGGSTQPGLRTGVGR
jgi:hypothetical protein